MLCMPISVKRSEKVEKDGQQVEQVLTPHGSFTKTTGSFCRKQTARRMNPTRSLVGTKRKRWTVCKFEWWRSPHYARNRSVSVSPLAEQPESTLFHELAHVVLGHTSEGSLNSDSKDRTPRDIRELEAECVALLCCESLGLPGAAESRGYIQSWFHNNEVLERSAQRILHTADEILKAGRTA
jgi:hypothetical protein